ncbi:mitochondrial carrier domain-containing protein [Thamnocephalis sphaerospora]|uniref:Mitochondrial carrier domain-containing protein n=1 Tax=Thamnocephalis sphaerospora TaxID=78915 RepID=A0A4V1IWI6_9FUNG|nr:mitochondrial carrier domain-containing protein [Thamnocephalis sphaerospora]|eukprot:RKP07689.1 mitochondrial carrier domain-containing protein [Thamnocephalis sphaerospora]
MAQASKPKSYPFWFGGNAGLAACFTHPLDLVKVRFQTAKNQPSPGTIRAIAIIIRTEGPLALFNGLSASLLRQATYSTVRFGVYDIIKERIPKDEKGELQHLAATAVVAGGIGGVFGNPADVINVRMQNDGQLPVEQRRNYRHALDGLRRVTVEEGPRALFRGLAPNVQRATIITCAQLTSYDFFKQTLLATPYFTESIWTHLTASLLAGLVATTACAPVDVVKTRAMSASPGAKAKGTLRTMAHMVRVEGPASLFKGWVPAFTRLGPQTILTFLILEQIRAIYDKRHAKVAVVSAPAAV